MFTYYFQHPVHVMIVGITYNDTIIRLIFDVLVIHHGRPHQIEDVPDQMEDVLKQKYLSTMNVNCGQTPDANEARKY